MKANSFCDFHFASPAGRIHFIFILKWIHFHFAISILLYEIILRKSQNHFTPIHFHFKNENESCAPTLTCIYCDIREPFLRIVAWKARQSVIYCRNSFGTLDFRPLLTKPSKMNLEDSLRNPQGILKESLRKPAPKAPISADIWRDPCGFLKGTLW